MAENEEENKTEDTGDTVGQIDWNWYWLTKLRTIIDSKLLYLKRRIFHIHRTLKTQKQNTNA